MATDEEGVPHLKSYRKLKAPTTSSSISSKRVRLFSCIGKTVNHTSDESLVDPLFLRYHVEELKTKTKTRQNQSDLSAAHLKALSRLPVFRWDWIPRFSGDNFESCSTSLHCLVQSRMSSQARKEHILSLRRSFVHLVFNILS